MTVVLDTTIAWLREIVEGATAGPWKAHYYGRYAWESWSIVAAGDEPPVADDALIEADARAIAALRNVAPALLAVVEAASESTDANDRWTAAWNLKGDLHLASAETHRVRDRQRDALRALDAAIRAEMERQS